MIHQRAWKALKLLDIIWLSKICFGLHSFHLRTLEWDVNHLRFAPSFFTYIQGDVWWCARKRKIELSLYIKWDYFIIVCHLFTASWGRTMISQFWQRLLQQKWQRQLRLLTRPYLANYQLGCLKNLQLCCSSLRSISGSCKFQVRDFCLRILWNSSLKLLASTQ